ncbi:hypothetical protein BGZ76_006401 [Entomortierella beljakovae]|nr:hypothetical protein BGZ76_006401 [Entomortierella beljakovae]
MSATGLINYPTTSNTANSSDRSLGINTTTTTLLGNDSMMETIIQGFDSISNDLSLHAQPDKRSQHSSTREESNTIKEAVIEIPDYTRSRTISFTSRPNVWGTIPTESTADIDTSSIRQRTSGGINDQRRGSDSSYQQSQNTNSSQQNLLQNLAPQQPSREFSSNGKRYHDSRKKKSSEKAITKTALTLFSNERTFIHWIKFAMLLGVLAMTLLNFSVEDALSKVSDRSLAARAGRIGKAVGVCLLIICLICLLYATLTFHWRHLGIARDRKDDRYFDRVGPTVLTLALLATYAVNVVLTLQVTFNMDPNYVPVVFYNQNTNASSTLSGISNNALPLSPLPHPPPPISTRPFDIPPLPNGSTIMVESEDDDYDDYDDDRSDNSSNSQSTTNDSNASQNDGSKSSHNDDSQLEESADSDTPSDE